jgi:hypothetical protein
MWRMQFRAFDFPDVTRDNIRSTAALLTGRHKHVNQHVANNVERLFIFGICVSSNTCPEQYLFFLPQHPWLQKAV